MCVNEEIWLKLRFRLSITIGLSFETIKQMILLRLTKSHSGDEMTYRPSQDRTGWPNKLPSGNEMQDKIQK